MQQHGSPASCASSWRCFLCTVCQCVASIPSPPHFPLPPSEGYTRYLHVYACLRVTHRIHLLPYLSPPSHAHTHTAYIYLTSTSVVSRMHPNLASHHGSTTTNPPPPRPLASSLVPSAPRDFKMRRRTVATTTQCSSCTSSAELTQRSPRSHCVGEEANSSISKGVMADPPLYGDCPFLADHRSTHTNVCGSIQHGFQEAKRTHRRRRRLTWRLVKRMAVCVLLLLLPCLLYDSAPPSVQRRPRCVKRGATTTTCTPSLFVRAVRQNLMLTFKANEELSDACIKSLTTRLSTPALLSTSPAPRGSPWNGESAVMLVNVSACPYYLLWSLLAGNGTVEEPVSVPARKEKEEAGGRPHVDMASRAKVEGRLDASMEDATEGRNRGATKAALRDLTRTLSGQRSALTSYYEALNADRPFVMLQGATIHITIDTSVSLFYHVTTFREHIASNTLRVSPTGGGGSVNDLSRAGRTPPSSVSTRSSVKNVDDDDDDDDTDDETYPDISLQTVFFFWNWPSLHCTFNAPALMSRMIDLANEQGTAVPRQLRDRPPRAAKSNFLRPMPLGHDTALAEGKAGRTVDEVAANPPPASSGGGSPVYPSCAASMPPPKNILPPEALNNSFLQDIMQLNTALVLKIFRFDVWYQLTNTPVPTTLAAARINTDAAAAAAAQASAAYSTLFSSDTATTRSGDGRSTGSLDAKPSHNLRANAERVCTAPALYTIPLNALLAQASSWNLGSAADWLQSSVGVTHNYPGAPVIAVVAQCSGIPLSFAVTVNFVNPGNYAGSGEHIPTAIMFLSLLACYVILLIVFLVMILSCSKQRQCCGAGVEKDEKSHTSPSDDGPRQATAAHGEQQTPTGSDQRPANREIRSSASKLVWGRRGRGRERRGDTAAEGADRQNRHRQDNDKGQELQVMGAGEANAGKCAVPHGAEGRGVKASSRDSSEWTSWAETAVAKAHVLTLRHTADIHQDVTEDEPIRTEAGKSGGGRVGPRPRQTHQDERPVGGDLRRDDEGDNSLRCQSPFYSMRSDTSSPLPSDDDGRRDTNSGQSDARKEEAREGLSGRGSGSAQSSQRRRTPTSSSVTYSSSSSSSSIYSRSLADDDTDCSSSSTHSSTSGGDDDDDDDSNSDEGRSARCRHRQKQQKRQREAEARRRRGHEQRKRGIPARTTALSTTNALVSPRRWRSRVVRMTDFVLSQVVEPLRLRWAKSHIVVMYPPMQWLVLALLMLKCLLSVFFSAHFALLAGLRLTASIGRSLALAGIILQVATQSLLIPTEMLVSMGWGLAFTAHMPTNKTVVVHLSTFVMFIVYVLAATCGDNGLNMALTANRYTKIINGNYCNTVEYMRAALELLLTFHNVLRMFFLSMWLSKTVIPADAAAAQRQRHLRQKQAQHAQRKSTEEKDRGAAGTDISTGDKASNQYDSRHRAPSASSSGQRHGPRSVSTTDDVSSSPISLPPPPRLAYPDVTLSAMDVYLRYRGMRLPFAMLLLWPVLLLVFSFTFYDLEDYYMVVALREVHTLHLLGFIIMFFRTSSPLYF